MRVLDLFCGAGGFSKGFEQAGFKIVLGIDNDTCVRETFEENHDAEFLEANVQDIPPKEIQESYGPIDVVIGSPPCQLCSTSNPNYDPEQGIKEMELPFNFYDELQAKHLVIENTHYVRKYVQDEYPTIRTTILNAADYGVPQKRKRLFFGYFPEPLPTHSKNLLTNPFGEKLLPWNKLSSILEPFVTWGLLTEQRVLRLAKSKGREGYSVEFPDPLFQPARTVLASISKMNQNTFVVDPNGYYRYLTIREVSRLQGFPDDFLWFGSPTDVQRMIGNAVPPPLARAIAQAILDSDPIPVATTEQAGTLQIQPICDNIQEECTE